MTLAYLWINLILYLITGADRLNKSLVHLLVCIDMMWASVIILCLQLL